MPICVILAAGEGTRMNSRKPKVLSEILFYPMLGWVLDSVNAYGIRNVCVVTGYRHEMVSKFIKKEKYNCRTVIQDNRKGTAHAVMTASNFIKQHMGEDILVLNGDSPFIDSKTIMNAYDIHKLGSYATIVSAKLDSPTGYGRIIRNKLGSICAIIEEKDADLDQKRIKEINSGIYWFKSESLLDLLSQIKESESGEFYLTSVISILIENNKKVSVYLTDDPSSVLGANNPEQLKILNQIANEKIIEKFKSKGVYIPYENNVLIGKNVQIGEGTTILSDVTILEDAKIGKDCVIGPGTNILGGKIPDNTNLIFHDDLSSRDDFYKEKKCFAV
ncbi:MAG: NTP transferase domain-containing protein [Oscillospiraceae bacterium]|nr:NTP transferase domain-containing protein [Oscillospiraceae bacterium]